MNCNSILNDIEFFFIDFISNLKSCICIESDKEVPIQTYNKKNIKMNNQENFENESKKKNNIDDDWVNVTY